MVNIHGRRCHQQGCGKQPTFGRKGQKVREENTARARAREREETGRWRGRAFFFFPSTFFFFLARSPLQASSILVPGCVVCEQALFWLCFPVCSFGYDMICTHNNTHTYKCICIHTSILFFSCCGAAKRLWRASNMGTHMYAHNPFVWRTIYTVAEEEVRMHRSPQRRSAIFQSPKESGASGGKRF